MILFDSSNYNNNDIDYLNFDNNFKVVIENRIKIVFAPNGSCKTSIYKYIQKNNSNFDFIDYEEIKESFIKGAKKDIKIGASIGKIEELTRIKEEKISNLRIKENFAKFDIKNSTVAKNISNEIEKVRNNESECIKVFSGDRITKLFQLNNDQKNFLVKSWSTILSKKEEIIKLEDMKNQCRMEILNLVDNYIDDDTKICPVCGYGNELTIREKINKTKKEISQINDNLWNQYRQKSSKKDFESTKTEIEELINVVKDNDINNIDIRNFIICGGDEKNGINIINTYKEIDSINKQINDLENKRNNFYLEIKKHEDELRSIFGLQFNIEADKIIFDDENKVLTISLQRKASDHSTGEINLLVFITKIIGYFGNDKECLVCDDPISSYDIPNQYRILYEIAKTKDISNKKVLILTHNIDTINIANTQRSDYFDYEFVDKIGNKLYINKLESNDTTTIIDFSKMIESIKFSDLNNIYLKLLCERDDDSKTDEISRIFHYDCYEKYEYEAGKFVDNDYFVSLIDNFSESTFINETFVMNTIMKIIYILALRVWIEKQIYLNCSNTKAIKTLTFGEKVMKMFSDSLWKGDPIFSKEFLMSKKVMLNQNFHLKSQKLPFYYILNLTLDDIKNEIIDIKSHMN